MAGQVTQQEKFYPGDPEKPVAFRARRREKAWFASVARYSSAPAFHWFFVTRAGALHHDTYRETGSH
jgi:hypothetical protein